MDVVVAGRAGIGNWRFRVWENARLASFRLFVDGHLQESQSERSYESVLGNELQLLHKGIRFGRGRHDNGLLFKRIAIVVCNGNVQESTRNTRVKTRVW